MQSEIASIQKSFSEELAGLMKPWRNCAVQKGMDGDKKPRIFHGLIKRSSWLPRKTVPFAKEQLNTPAMTARGLALFSVTIAKDGGKSCASSAQVQAFTHKIRKQKCPMCHGTRFSLCRYCNGTGKLPCVSCQGRGNTPCASCKGSGFVSREVIINKGARVDFSHTSSSGLPSGLLRMISRIGDDKIYRGHADINIIEGEPEKKKSITSVVIKLEAKIPYADIKLRIGKRAG